MDEFSKFKDEVNFELKKCQNFYDLGECSQWYSKKLESDYVYRNKILVDEVFKQLEYLDELI